MFFNEFFGMEGTDDFHVAVVRIEAHHKNPTGNINGGLFLALADTWPPGSQTTTTGRSSVARRSW